MSRSETSMDERRPVLGTLVRCRHCSRCARAFTRRNIPRWIGQSRRDGFEDELQKDEIGQADIMPAILSDLLDLAGLPPLCNLCSVCGLRSAAKDLSDLVQAHIFLGAPVR